KSSSIAVWSRAAEAGFLFGSAERAGCSCSGGRVGIRNRAFRIGFGSANTRNRQIMLLDLLFTELACQSAPMHAESTRGFRDVEAGLGQRFVDALPLQRLDRGRAVGQFDLGGTGSAAEGGLDVVSVRGLGQVVAGAGLGGLDGGGNARGA